MGTRLARVCCTCCLLHKAFLLNKSPTRRPPLRSLHTNNLDGSVPSQLGALTALTELCATALQQPLSQLTNRGHTRGEGETEGGGVIIGARVALVALSIQRSLH